MLHFAPRISVHVSRDAFLFTHKEATHSFGTVLWIERNAKGPRVCGIGEAGASTPGAVPVGLFDGQPCDVLPVDQGRMWALEAFLAHAIMTVLGRRLMIRPSVVITGLESLQATLAGYQAAILTRAFIAAGAQYVAIEPTGDAVAQ